MRGQFAVVLVGLAAYQPGDHGMGFGHGFGSAVGGHGQ